MGLAAVFAVALWVFAGPAKALEFVTAWIVEKSLSVDNLFVFVAIFSMLSIPSTLQHRVLFWGILGALVLRGAFIAAGAALLSRFHALFYLFGAILLVTAVRLFAKRETVPRPEHSRTLRLLHRFLPLTPTLSGSRFFVRKAGRLLATPLFVALVIVEVSDLVFALDSIPAVFGVTLDPFVVWTSNVFAILGLRSLYFVLASSLDRLRHLRAGLSIVLGFVGVKMLLVDLVRIPVAVSLGVIAGVLGTTVVLSWTHRGRRVRKGAAIESGSRPSPRASSR